MRWHHAVLVLALVVTSRVEPPAHAPPPHQAEYRVPSRPSPVNASKRTTARTADAGRHASATSPAPRPPRFVLADPPRTYVVSRPEPPATTADLAVSPVHGARAPPQA
jgi:hypothetical protein